MYQLDLNILTFFLIFYIYCFLGWCFESTYVSIKTGKWVNRGFMKGPFLPIYGCGAVIILFSTIPVMNNPLFVYLLSFIGATVLEFVTGVVMEKLFKVKYWDYSGNFMNYKGYICIKSSITWGFMGMLVTYIINEPVAKFIDSLNIWISAFIVAVITVIFAIDFIKSFRAAYNMREIIISSAKLMNELNEIKMQISEAIEVRKEQASEKRSEVIAEIKEKIGEALSYTEIDEIIIDKLEDFKRLDMEDYVNMWKEKAGDMKEKISALDVKKISLLRRNPSARSKIAKEIKNFMKKKEDDKKNN